MSFPTIRPNATKWELSNEQMEEFRAVTDTYAFCTSRPYTQMVNATLLALYKHYGAEKVCAMIERWVMLGYFSLDSLVGLCSGKIPSERTKQVNEMPGKERVGSSVTKPVSEFLQEHPEKLARPRKPLPAGWMTRENAIKWMAEHHPNDLDLIDQFFQDLGLLDGVEIYQLIVRQ